MNDDLRAELAGLFERDREVRTELWQAVRKHGPTSHKLGALQKRSRLAFTRNAERLAEILDEHGWPGVSLVGEEAAEAAFILLQHADVEIQKKYLPLLREATAAGEMKTTCLPLLEDRVRMHEGHDQLYGSQFIHGKNGKPELWPIEDEARVDERRAAVGLEPLAAYLERVGLGHIRKDDAGA